MKVAPQFIAGGKKSDFIQVPQGTNEKTNEGSGYGSFLQWISDTFPSHRDFEWQEGYGAFSVSISHVKTTIAYINNQHQHHRQETFEEEYRKILKKHGIEYDERYLLG